MPNFIRVVQTSTGRIRRVPEHYLDNPVLSKGLKRPPSLQAADRLAGDPSEEWRVNELRTYAAEHAVDLAGVTTKADILAAIETATNTSDANQADDETPATGDDKE